jgi:hypothetical protein
MNTTGEVITFEFITVGGVTYAKGLTGIPGVNPHQWYKFPRELGNVTHDAPSVKTLLTEFQLEDFRRGKFQAAGTEQVDGLECTVWSAQNPTLAKDFIGIANSPEAAGQLRELDDAEFKVSTCPDGFMHRITGSVKGHNPDAPSQRAFIRLTFHIFDHGAEIAITAPPDAIDFQVPALRATSTP